MYFIFVHALPSYVRPRRGAEGSEGLRPAQAVGDADDGMAQHGACGDRDASSRRPPISPRRLGRESDET